MSFDACNHEKGNLKYNIVRIINLETPIETRCQWTLRNKLCMICTLIKTFTLFVLIRSLLGNKLKLCHNNDH